MHKTDIDGVGVEKRCHIVAAYDEADNCRDSIGGQVDFGRFSVNIVRKAGVVRQKAVAEFLTKKCMGFKSKWP